MQKIILIGYMGVGKTTVAQILAEKLNWEWVDLDKIIESKAQLSIPQIFEKYGEIYFRKLEHELFKEAVQSERQLIISTGGGTPCYANNHLLLNGKGIESIYLKASIGAIFDRLKTAKNNRPLIANQTDEELKEFIAKNLFDRSYFYIQATHKVEIDDKSPATVANEILERLH
ncbi:shikimate kinase [Flavobacterium silvisoli]|uniref:Shikimate kinase n=1 Tax=Flavobacterium silvisoli TaxID=2529433 RepID=A0A4Q9YQI1_9FLAO|nr:shikimate kinase [Flavobacterium silvisoli]TBX65765.1 shikimate kinase [Flavobacterium silvisoli]